MKQHGLCLLCFNCRKAGQGLRCMNTAIIFKSREIRQLCSAVKGTLTEKVLFRGSRKKEW